MEAEGDLEKNSGKAILEKTWMRGLMKFLNLKVGQSVGDQQGMKMKILEISR